MKVYNRVLLTLVVIIGVLSTLILMRIRPVEKEPSDPQTDMIYFTALFESSISNENLEVNNPLVYKGNDTADKTYLYDLVRDKCLVFRFSGESCSACIDFAMGKIKSVFKDFATNDRILFIGSNINERMKDRYYGKPVISFDSEDLGLPFEEYTTPFIFIMDRERITKMLFVPDKTMPGLTDFYLNLIKERYFSTPDAVK
jgi:hypothetical protein